MDLLVLTSASGEHDVATRTNVAGDNSSARAVWSRSQASSAASTALTSATGLVIRDLPLTPERVWRATVEAKNDSD